MPRKHNADRRRHIPKMSFKVQNWPAYEAGLRRRGSLTLWIEDAVLGDWQSTGPGGQARYTDAAIETTMGRYKALIGPRLRVRGFAAQRTEAAIGVAVLNRMLAAGRPHSIRRQPIIA